MTQKRYKVELLTGEFSTDLDEAWTEEETAQALNNMSDQPTETLRTFDTYEEAKAFFDTLEPVGVIVSGNTGFLYEAEQIWVMGYTKDEDEGWEDAEIEWLDAKTSAYCEKPDLVLRGKVQGWYYELELEVKAAIRYFETYGEDEQADKMRELLKKLEPYEDSDDMFIITKDGELQEAEA